MSKKLIDRGYKETEIYDSISRAFDRNRENLLSKNDEPNYRISLPVTSNRTLQNLKVAVKNYWNILQINNVFKDVFTEPPITYISVEIKNLEEFLWTYTIVNNKRQKVSNRKGYAIPSQSRTGNLFCKQVKHTNIFLSTFTKRTYNIYKKLNSKSSYLIYLMKCTLCKW